MEPFDLTFTPLVAASIPDMLENAIHWGVTFLASLAVLAALGFVIHAAWKSRGALGAIVSAAVAGIVLVAVVRYILSGQGAKTGEDTLKAFEIAIPPGTFRALTSWILGA